MPSHHVVILLATYQGAAHLQQQLDSLAAQTHADWSLIASDDGSTDATPAILARFADAHPRGRVRIVPGPRAGATANFLSLLEQVPEGAFAAFCDQDDLWFPPKLQRAVAALADLTGPGHYAARTIITDAHLTPLTPSRRFLRPLSFRNALVQACMAGNTSVFDPQAVRLLQRAAPDARRAGILSHDWWAYQVTAGHGATLIHDPEPSLLYRQHARSEVGRNDTLPALAARLRQLMAGDFGDWLRTNHDSLAPLDLTPDARRTLAHLHDALTARAPQAVMALRRGGFYRQTRAGTAALYLSAMAGRLKG